VFQLRHGLEDSLSVTLRFLNYSSMTMYVIRSLLYIFQYKNVLPLHDTLLAMHRIINSRMTQAT